MNHFFMKALAAAALSVGMFAQSASAQVIGDISPYPGNGGHHEYRPDRPNRPRPGHGYSEISRQNSRRIARLLYQAILFRNGEPAGVQHHAYIMEMNGIEGLGEVGFGMAESDEFYRNILPRYTPRQIVQNIYRVVFNRPADPEGLQHWARMIRQGQAGEALRGIVLSDEFLNRHVYSQY